MYFRGSRLIAVGRKGGREVDIFITLDDLGLQALVELLKIPHTRKAVPEKKNLVKKINNTDAVWSGYAGVFKACGFVPDRSGLCFW